jgi:hypothetical protein
LIGYFAPLPSSPFPNDLELSLKFMAVDPERTHIRADDVFTELAIHLDDHRPWQPGAGHDQMIASDPRLNAAK